MGGKAFANEDPPLPTPRMPELVYKEISQELNLILRGWYSHVASPIDAPEKRDHGDIDILVSGADATREELSHALGAQRSIKNGSTTSFAVPWPQTPATYVQVDIHHCQTLDNFSWTLFHQSHGDLWSILGTMIRPFGLLANETGLFLRIWEIEGKVPKDKAKVFLTSDPATTLEFLGLDEGKFARKFARLDEMFDYAMTCVFFDPQRWQERGILNANDRQRMSKRPQYREWVTYLSQRGDSGPRPCSYLSKEDTVDMCKKTFGIADQYDLLLNEGLQKIRKDTFWTDVRKIVPYTDLRLGIVMRGLKREILSDEDSEDSDTTREVADVRQMHKAEDFDRVEQWITENWQKVEGRQTIREKEASARAMAAKSAKAAAVSQVAQSAGGVEDGEKLLQTP